jgi:T5orf172 domain
MATKKTLDDLFAEDDDLGLLKVKAPTRGVTSEEARIQSDFEEINNYIDLFGHAPGKGPATQKVTTKERILQTRLKVYLENPRFVELLKPLDRHNLLDVQLPAAPTSLDELLDLDDDLLSDPNDELFKLQNVRETYAKTDFVAQRQPCPDFEKFKHLFDETYLELKTGARRALPFALEKEIEAGDFFILKGVMSFVAEVNDPHLRNGKKNARLRVVFENGTECQYLSRSFGSELYRDPLGRRLSDPDAGPLFNPEPNTVSVPSDKDRVTGHIYIVRSLSPQPEIKELDGQLFKIGFTTGSVEDRLRGAADDPTFLLAPVHPVKAYVAVNMNTSKFETLIHRFFDEARLDIEIMDRFGKPFKPREWFMLPLEVIDEAVKKMIDGSIVNFRYDHKSCSIKQVNKS